MPRVPNMLGAVLVAAIGIGGLAPGRPPALAAEGRVLFEDQFDGKLADGWTWLRENPKNWRIRQGALEIRVEPGAGHDVKNALLRKAPDRSAGKIAIEVTVTFTATPTRQFEQAGITWYQGGTPRFKLVHELVDGQLMIIPGRAPAPQKTVDLRLVFEGPQYTAQFRPEGQASFQTVATGTLPLAADEQVSIQCYHGPPDEEHWIRFDNFRILQLP